MSNRICWDMKKSFMRLLFIGLVSLLLVFGIIFNASKKPAQAGEVLLAVTKLESLPKSIFYLKNSILLLRQDNIIMRSSNQGSSWENVELPTSSFQDLIHHPFEADTALVIGTDGNNYKSTDGGKSWNMFSLPNMNLVTGVEFTADPKKYLVKGNSCVNDLCYDSMYYTLDGLKTFDLLLSLVNSCVWDLDAGYLIYCTKWVDASQYGDLNSKGLQLVSSNTFFALKKQHDLGGGVVGLKYVHGFILAAVKPLSSNGNKLYVSKNGNEFNEARFPGSGDILNGFTVLDSSSFSLTVDILASNKSSVIPTFGTLYFSDDQGVIFTPSLEHTNHASNYLVDFETIQSYSYNGILLANVVKNYNEILQKDAFTEDDKQLESKLSFDHGRTWNFLKAPMVDLNQNRYSCEGPCNLHMHSVTHPHNLGKVFSTTSAPGLVIGIGSVGEYLKPYEQCDTFLSIDAGLSWRMITKGPYKYETAASGSIIILIPDGSGPHDHFLYSHDYGSAWEKKYVLLEEKKWIPWISLLDPDSKYQKILLIVISPDDLSSGWIVQMDLSKSILRKCDSIDPLKSNDFEKWSPSTNEDNCLLGQHLTYYRRKPDASCYIDSDFNPPETRVSSCECTKYDYECDAGFMSSGIKKELECVPQKEFIDQPLDCKPGKSYLGSSGYRKVPGNKCQGGLNLLENVTRECVGDSPNLPNNSSPTAISLVFDSMVEQIFYVENSTIVLIITRTGSVFKSLKNGLDFYSVTSLKNVQVNKVWANEAIASRIYFYSKTNIWIIDDINESDTAYSLKLPSTPNSIDVPILDLHPTEKDWYVFASSPLDCVSSICYTSIYFTKDNGENWKQIETWAEKCVWARDSNFKNRDLDLDSIFCLTFINKNGNISQEKLRYNNDVGKNIGHEMEFVLLSDQGLKRNKLLERGALGFYVVSNVLVVAAKENSSSVLFVSSDGISLMKAEFPPEALQDQNIFTLLSGNENGLFVDVGKISSQMGSGSSGAVYKSNQDGNYFSKILGDSSRNIEGKVDFEKINGISGIIFANSVLNPNSAQPNRQIRSVISFDDGSTWRSISPPEFDKSGKQYDCEKQDRCKLHLHSRVGMMARRGIFSPKRCPGLLIASGNVGADLGDFVNSNIYLSRDGGLHWSEILIGTYQWAMGDFGNIIVFTEEIFTNKLRFTVDFGKTFSEFQFTEKLFKIDHIESSPNSDSLNFFVVGTDWNNPTSSRIFSVDFKNFLTQKCSKQDLISWSPNGGKSECMLGTKRTLLQRKTEAVCYFGQGYDPLISSESKKCTCSKMDYECDYGFLRSFDGACSLVGTDLMAPKDCKKGEIYQGSSGYRRVSLSECENGEDLTQKVDRMCGTNMKAGKTKIDAFFFNETMIQFNRFNKSSSLVIRTSGGLYQSKDDGSNWSKLFPTEHVISFIMDTHRNNRAFVITDRSVLYVTNDSGETYNEIMIPLVVDLTITAQPISTHPAKNDWLLLIGAKNCKTAENGCQTDAFVSWNTGKSWTSTVKNSLKCVWGNQGEFISHEKTNIFCLQIPIMNDPRRSSTSKNKTLVRLNDPKDPNTLFELFKASEFAIFEKFMLAISTTSKLMVTLDGSEWAEAIFPEGIEVSSSFGYTILQGSTGSIFLELLTNNQDYGSLFKSNWNGTIFSHLLDRVHHDGRGFVDFEKINGLDGAFLVNKLIQSKDGESLQRAITQISHDDGLTWKSLNRPNRDSKGIEYECTNCSLNLHAYTDRNDKPDQYSINAASGLLLGAGNVGKYLNTYNDSRMFLSIDAGITWREIADKAYMYEVAESGSVFILANDFEPSATIRYSINQGVDIRDLAIDHKIGGGRLLTTNILSSGISSHFIVLGSIQGGTMDGKFTALHIDFSSVWPRQCKDNEDKAMSDYESWNYLDGACNLGQKAEYFRRKSDRDCSPIGDSSLPKANFSPCECTRNDFECDYDYELGQNNDCIFKGSDLKAEPLCVNGFKRHSKGYKKKAISKCTKGLEEMYEAELFSCGTQNSRSLFLETLVAISGLGIVLFLASKHYTNGLGRIRLPNDGFSSPNFQLSEFASSFKETISGVFFWIFDTIILVKDEINHRLRPTEYRYTAVSSIPHPSFEYVDFDDY